MQIYRTVSGNTSPSLSITCERNGTAIDLSSATSVVLKITNEKTGEDTQSSGACTVTSPATSGIVTYDPVSTDFPAKGRYIGEITISFPGKAENIVEQILFVAREPNT